MACMMMFVPVEMKKEADLVLSMPDILVVVAIGMPDGLNRLCGKTVVRGIMVSHPCWYILLVGTVLSSGITDVCYMTRPFMV